MKTLVTLILFGLAALGCGVFSGDAPVECPARAAPKDRFDGEGRSCSLYDHHGPFEVGVMETKTAEGLQVAVFYPATADACAARRFIYDLRDYMPEEDRYLFSDEDSPTFEVDAALDVPASSEGPFPVVLFSHGLGGYRHQSATLLSHIASWGFVVASAEHEERNLARMLEHFFPSGDLAPEALREVVEYLAAANLDPEHRLHGKIDLSRVASTGHSMGGNGATSMIGEAGVRATIFYATRPSVPEDADVASFWMAGTNDDLIRTETIRARYEDGPAPKRYLAIEDAGHNAFSDICAIGKDRGGILRIADEAGMEIPGFFIQMANDGCRDEDLDAELSWPIIHHYSVAHLRHALGMDDEPRGLSHATTACFEEITSLEWDEVR